MNQLYSDYAEREAGRKRYDQPGTVALQTSEASYEDLQYEDLRDIPKQRVPP